MDAKQFLAEFKHIASAPGGVQRLREMIYNLAITGDLTRQLLTDGDAGQLLEEIRRTKAARIREKQFKRSPKLENLASVIPTNIKLPEAWRWSRLVDIGEINPKNEVDDDTLASFIPMSGIPQLHSGKLETEQRTWGSIKKGFTHFADGDVVLGKITPCFENGKAAVITRLSNGVGAGTTELHVVRPLRGLVEPTYIYLFLRSPYFRVEGEGNMTGTAGQKRLPTEYFATRAFPMPPYAEQKRIIAKVDELMALCDKLEALQRRRQSLGKTTRSAALDALAVADTSQEIGITWSRFSANLSIYLSEAESVEELKRKLLTLAIQGKLVPQDWSDEDAKQLLEKISHERAKFSWRKERRSRKDFSAIVEPYSLPRGWAWTRLADLTAILNGRAYKQEELLSSGTPVLRVGNLFTSDKWYYSDLELEADKYCDEEDLLYAWSASFGPFIWKGPRSIYHYHIWKLDLYSHEFLNRDYLYLFLLEKTEEIRAAGHGVSMTHMTKEKMEQLLVPVPPLAEQQRIVEKVAALNIICDRLHEQRSELDKIGTLLADESISTFTGIRAEEREKMKSPKNELVSRLRLGVSPTTKDQAPLASILIKHNGELSAKTLWNSSGLEIDVFYQQLKIEMAKGWIVQPEAAYVKEVEAS